MRRVQQKNKRNGNANRIKKEGEKGRNGEKEKQTKRECRASQTAEATEWGSWISGTCWRGRGLWVLKEKANVWIDMMRWQQRKEMGSEMKPQTVSLGGEGFEVYRSVQVNVDSFWVYRVDLPNIWAVRDSLLNDHCLGFRCIGRFCARMIRCYACIQLIPIKYDRVLMCTGSATTSTPFNN